MAENGVNRGFAEWVGSVSRRTNRSMAGSRIHLHDDDPLLRLRAAAWGIVPVGDGEAADMDSAAGTPDARSMTGSEAIDHASGSMPVLHRLMGDLRSEVGFAGVRIAACLILEPKTTVFLEELADAGAVVGVFCGPDSTDERVIRDLRGHGVTVRADRRWDSDQAAAVAQLIAHGRGMPPAVHRLDDAMARRIASIALEARGFQTRTGRADADDIRSRIAVVFQQFNLFPHMTVMRNVTLGAVKVHHWDRRRAEDRANSLLARIGMKDKAGAYPDQLSGGQQQRVAIIRALMTNPRLLLLDETTSALDPMLVGEVLDMVSELRSQGTTILMATHEMGFAHDAANRVLLLRHGTIAENGTPQEVMDESADPETREFFRHFRR